MNDIAKIVSDLFTSANGRLFFIGSVLAGGSAYYVLDKGSDQITFAYLSLFVGTLMIILSMAMAFYSKAMQGRERMETRRLDAEIREKRMEHGEADRTIYRVDE